MVALLVLEDFGDFCGSSLEFFMCTCSENCCFPGRLSFLSLLNKTYCGPFITASCLPSGPEKPCIVTDQNGPSRSRRSALYAGGSGEVARPTCPALHRYLGFSSVNTNRPKTGGAGSISANWHWEFFHSQLPLHHGSTTYPFRSDILVRLACVPVF